MLEYLLLLGSSTLHGPHHYTRALTQNMTFQSVFFSNSLTLTLSIYRSGSLESQALNKGLESQFPWQPDLKLIVILNLIHGLS